MYILVKANAAAAAAAAAQCFTKWKMKNMNRLSQLSRLSRSNLSLKKPKEPMHFGKTIIFVLFQIFSPALGTAAVVSDQAILCLLL